MKELSKLLSSFNLRCGLSFSADMSGQPMAVIKINAFVVICSTNNSRFKPVGENKWIIISLNADSLRKSSALSIIRTGVNFDPGL